MTHLAIRIECEDTDMRTGLHKRCGTYLCFHLATTLRGLWKTLGMTLNCARWALYTSTLQKS